MLHSNENGLHSPDSPLTPLIECVRYWKPSFDFGAIDIVTDRNCLRKLFAWAQEYNSTPRYNPKEFRIDLQYAKNGSILFTRWEGKTREPVSRSYSLAFESATTRAQGANPPWGHHRIVTYVSSKSTCLSVALNLVEGLRKNQVACPLPSGCMLRSRDKLGCQR